MSPAGKEQGRLLIWKGGGAGVKLGSSRAAALVIDGSFGEGGGQILRTALALSLVKQRPFRMTNIRKKREKPGLMRQHLTAVRAAAEIGKAGVEGARLGSTEIAFYPQGIFPGAYRFNIGTAGSTTLVLQTILPPLLLAEGPSQLVLEGGTHNPLAPPFEFMEKSFFPILSRMGASLTLSLSRPGFYPVGGGKIQVSIQPAKKLEGLDLRERGRVRRCRAKVWVVGLPQEIAEREVRVLRERLAWPAEALEITYLASSFGCANLVMAEVQSEQVTEVFTVFGEKGLRAEKVAEKVASQVAEYLDSEVPVGSHLADQLLIPFALAGEGSFKTLPLSNHALTNVAVIEMFLETQVVIKLLQGNQWLVEFGKR